MSNHLNFRPDSPGQKVLLTWHQSLEETKGDRALLRRAPSPLEVIFVPAYHRLLHALRDTGAWVNEEALAAVAGLAAHVREHRPDASLPTQMGRPKEGRSTAVVHEHRFQRLLTHETRDELYQPMIRVIRLLDGRVHLTSLADDVYWWEQPGDSIRKRWAYKYYDVAPKAS